MKKIAVFIGTRPEAIKMAPVISALQKAEGLQPIIVSTGQHKEMLQQVVDIFGIDVDHELNVMQPNQTLASLTARLMTAIDELLGRLEPDLALVQGDTTTVLVAALACFYRRIAIGHVEAGLRTGHIWSPFPEEVNRTLVCPLITLHFPPTERSQQNLLREGVDPDRIVVTGNTVIDALHMEVVRQQDPQVREQIHTNLNKELGQGWEDHPYVLITGHRRENFGQGFEQICDALEALAQRFKDHRFIYAVHLNPNVQQVVHRRLAGYSNIHLIEPQAYSEFVALMNGCDLILTDSGGVQEEAPSLGKPVLVMRDTTERPEGVQAGTVQLVGANADSIISGVSTLLESPSARQALGQVANPYGDGRASQRIVTRIQEYWTNHGQPDTPDA